MKPRRNTVGVIGCGQIASAVHLPVLHAMGFEVCWVLDPNATSTREVSRALSATALTSSAELPGAEAPEVILIACPYGVRGKYYRFLESNMMETAILVEKPIALTAAEHDSIAALRSDHLMGAGYNRRGSVQVKLVKNILRSGMLGKLKSIDFQCGGLGIKTSGKYTANLQLAGGGPLVESGVHGMDSILFMLGATDVTVESAFMQLDDGFDVHTSATLHVTSATGTVPCSILVTVLENTTNSIRLEFEQSWIEFSVFRDGVTLIPRDTAAASRMTITDVDAQPTGSHVKECCLWTDFLQAVRSGQPNHASLVNSRLTSSLVEGIYLRGKLA